jgi:sigma-54 dependent transcriptional regulator, acetoin dehydrogenase operon transcriptional activator AcoR
MTSQSYSHNYSHQLRYARERFLDNGEIPEGVLPESISRSWQRCVSTGLAIEPQHALEPAPELVLHELREKNAQLLKQSQVEMENLYAHIMGSQSMVLLSDAEGTILHAMGDPDFMSKAQRVALQPGVSWREDMIGTNAIGTAVVEKSPVYVKGAEHYVERNGFLNCSAAPILDAQGQVLGVLDVSGDYRRPQEHTMALVRMSAQMIENRLFNVNYSQDLIMRFHTRAEFINTLWEGIAVFSPAGQLIAMNRSASMQLGSGERLQIGVSFEALFGLHLNLFLDAASKRFANEVHTLTFKSGLQIYVKLDPVPVSLRAPSAYSKPQAKVAQTLALDLLDHGDANMQRTLHKAKLVLGHDIPVLIEAETGTGKELLARAMHQSGARRNAPFVAINCAAIPEGLVESELFGHEEGAFTGARRRGASGRIQQAHGGTLFLDEIGDMPMALQSSLLRVLQEREVWPLGASKPVPVDVAIIAATNTSLKQKVVQKQFREDLYYRLNGLRLSLPSLRERTDFAALVQHILRENLARPEVTVQPECLALLQRYNWPGNIRQLNHVLRAALIFMQGTQLQTQHLADDFLEDLALSSTAHAPSAIATASANDMASQQAQWIRQALDQHQGNISAAAHSLGISRATMYRKVRSMRLA